MLVRMEVTISDILVCPVMIFHIKLTAREPAGDLKRIEVVHEGFRCLSSDHPLRRHYCLSGGQSTPMKNTQAFGHHRPVCFLPIHD